MKQASPRQAPDARRSNRTAITLKARCRRSSWQVGDAVLANISADGCCLAVGKSPWTVGQPVTIRAAPSAPLSGTVRWLEEGRVGIEFESSLDDEALGEILEWAEISR